MMTHVGHFADKRTTYKFLHLGYYWPTLFRDAKNYVKSCDSCQWMGRPVQADEMPLQAQALLDPFEKFALDFVVPISPMSHKKRYILVYTDYVTQWVEAKSLFQATKKVVVDFLFHDIFTCFGVPRETVTDQGVQFTSKLVQSITK